MSSPTFSNRQFTGFGSPANGFSDQTPNQQAFEEAHKESDVDTERGSQHHTLGFGPLQAAPGNHSHLGHVRVYQGASLPVGWLRLDGAIINQVDYPKFFASAGVSTTTMTLPNYSGLIVRVV